VNGESVDFVHQVGEGDCPVMASYGAKDRTLRKEALRLELALSAAGVDHDVKEYPGLLRGASQLAPTRTET
jgi:hypothetical protein